MEDEEMTLVNAKVTEFETEDGNVIQVGYIIGTEGYVLRFNNEATIIFSEATALAIAQQIVKDIAK